jgi:hypothetical protein
MASFEMMFPAPQQQQRAALDCGRQQGVGGRQCHQSLIRRVPSADFVAEQGDQRQGDAGGQREVEFVDEIPDAEIRAGPGGGLALAPSVGQQVGQQGRRQRQFGAERGAAGGADQGEGEAVAGVEQEGPDEAGDRQHHARQPGAHLAVAAGERDPARQGEAAADEVDDEEQSLPFLQAQHVSDEEQHQRCRDRRGDAAAGEHRQQAAEARVGEHGGERQARRRIAGRSCRRRAGESGQRGEGEYGNEDPAQMLHGRGDILRQQRRQGGRHHHAAQREHLARGGDADALLRRFADLGTPGVIVDGGQAEADEGQAQAQYQPGQATYFAAGGRRQQRREAEAEQRQGDGNQPAPVAEAIAPLPQQRIDQGIGETRQQQHGADQRQRQADAVGIQLGNMHIERQRGEGQRKAERAVGQHLPRRHHAGGHHPAPSRLARSPGSRVRGSSQMAKKARANSTSSMRPVSLPWW